MAPFDVEGLLPSEGLLSLFCDPIGDHARVSWTAPGTSLARATWAPDDAKPFVECGVDVLPELHLPVPSSAFLGVSAKVALPRAALSTYWDDVWLPWRQRLRPGNAGEPGIHQLLGYAVGDDPGVQRADEEVLVGFDSDDRARMEWGDVQHMWTLIARDALAARRWDALRTTT